LFELCLELKKLEIEFNFVLHVLHVAGTRMIGEGTDGLSRGEVHAKDLLDPLEHHVPLGSFALKDSPQLLKWLSCCLEGDPFQVATPNDWCESAQQWGECEANLLPKTWVWDLPAIAAPHALEELAWGRLKRHDILRGVVIVPKRFAPAWFRRFTRTVDFYVSIPAGAVGWPSEMHESLIIAFYFLSLPHRPWDWKKVPFMVGLAWKVSSLFKNGSPAGWDLLREFWRASCWIQSMPQRVVRDLLSQPHFGRFLGVARKGSGDERRND
jgi:hypothetical protein